MNPFDTQTAPNSPRLAQSNVTRSRWVKSVKWSTKVITARLKAKFPNNNHRWEGVVPPFITAATAGNKVPPIRRSTPILSHRYWRKCRSVYTTLKKVSPVSPKFTQKLIGFPVVRTALDNRR